MAGPGTGGVTPRTTHKPSTSSTKRSDTQAPTRSGTRNKTFTSKGSNSATGSRTGKGDPGGKLVMTEKQANVEEQGTGRRRVVQEPGSTVDNSR